VVEETVSFLSFEIKKAQSQTHLSLSPVTVTGSSQELQQVLVNLVLNALYAMEDQPFEQRVVDIAVKDLGNEAHIEVTDRESV
jgi:C4-dicarboxylate-specific signal transduction histidine kinase